MNLIAVENLRSRFNATFGIGPTGFSEGMVCARMEPAARPPSAVARRVRVFVAGASGVIGRRLVPLLLADGSPGDRDDALAGEDERAARWAPSRCSPTRSTRDAVSERGGRRRAPGRGDPPAHLDPAAHQSAQDGARLRRSTTACASRAPRILVAAAQAAGAAADPRAEHRLLLRARAAGTVHGEQDPLFLERTAASSGAPRARSRSSSARVLDAGGIVLRYGYFYGPGSAVSRAGSIGSDVTRRRLPIVGAGGGVWSFIHVDDAARATVVALGAAAAGAYNVVDDEPARVSEWLPALAEALGAHAPRRVPALSPACRRAATASTMTRRRAPRNELAKRELGWQPQYPQLARGLPRGAWALARAASRDQRDAPRAPAAHDQQHP